MFSCGSNNNGSEETTASDTIIVAEAVEAEPGYEEWAYRTKTDEMYDSEMYLAYLYSENYIDLGFPDSGYIMLGIRYRERDGNQVLFTVYNGMFDCNSERNYIMIRFDKGEPQKFKVGPQMGSSERGIGLKNPEEFIKQVKNANTILIEAPFFEASKQVFRFSTSKLLVWEHGK